MDIIGKIERVLEEERFSSKSGDVSKFGFILSVSSGKYVKRVHFVVLGVERWDRLRQSVVEGNDVQVSFDVQSREWNGRWFTQCDAYRVIALSSSATSTNSSHSQSSSSVDSSSVGESVPF